MARQPSQYGPHEHHEGNDGFAFSREYAEWALLAGYTLATHAKLAPPKLGTSEQAIIPA
jgi:hypothetical protein